METSTQRLMDKAFAALERCHARGQFKAALRHLERYLRLRDAQ